jgi:murein DD-endopeptidase MepM/ murein hydrolase activator NlpD
MIKKTYLLALLAGLALFVGLTSTIIACSMAGVQPLALLFTETPTPTQTHLPAPQMVLSTATPIPVTDTFTPLPPTETPTATQTPLPVATQPVLLGLTLPVTATFTPSPTITLTPTITWTPSPTLSPTNTFTPTLTPTPTRTPTPTLSPTPYPTKDPLATFTPVPVYPSLSQVSPHFMFVRPIGQGHGNYVSPGYRYGETQQGFFPTHYGVDMPNPEGIPVLAAGDGVIVHAGNDWEVQLGPSKFFYGNAVVIRHHFDYRGAPVYTLYGHLSQVSVKVGDSVSAGQVIGLVGGTGVAAGGSHLHFEVRVGYNDYDSTRNPELWLKPYPSWGAIAGRVTDEQGKLVSRVDVSVSSIHLKNPAEGPVNRYVFTYEKSTVNPDEGYGENWAITDLPPGEYNVVVKSGSKSTSMKVIVPEGGLGWAEFSSVKVPPTWTNTPTPTATPRP